MCEGVQHAHQKGIIHRDLKPSNVLVTIQDDRPAPKIIDFGVAKATAQPLTEHSLFTELGVLIGTPEYKQAKEHELASALAGALPLPVRDRRRGEPSSPERLAVEPFDVCEAAQRRHSDILPRRHQQQSIGHCSAPWHQGRQEY
jgi:hypothetical protein